MEEWLAIPEKERAELIHGHIVYEAVPGSTHGFTQGAVFAQLWPYTRRGGRQGAGGGAKLGGWWIPQEVDMALGGIGCRPDVVGWRRDKHARVPQPDERGVVTAVPDFICEVLSSSTARYDQGPKRDAYFHASIPHYWLVDSTYKTLTVLERADRGYVIVLVAGPGGWLAAELHQPGGRHAPEHDAWLAALRAAIDDGLAAGEDATRRLSERVLSRAEARRKIQEAEVRIEELFEMEPGGAV